MEGVNYYVESPQVYRCGGAYAIDLRGVNWGEGSTVTTSNPHMTIVFARSGVKDQGVTEMNQGIWNWIQNENGGNCTVSFHLEKYGGRSMKVGGALFDLGIYLRVNFEHWQDDARPRPLHIQLFGDGDGQGNRQGGRGRSGRGRGPWRGTRRGRIGGRAAGEEEAVDERANTGSEASHPTSGTVEHPTSLTSPSTIVTPTQVDTPTSMTNTVATTPPITTIKIPTPSMRMGTSMECPNFPQMTQI